MSITVLVVILIVLILFSSFFAVAETALMSVNRYRLRHLTKSGSRKAILISRLLERPDKLLSVILIGSTSANIMASATATIIANNFFGKVGLLVCTISLTLVILIFSEVMPKTVAALRPMSWSFYVVWPLIFLNKLFYPLVWVINSFVLAMLRLLGISADKPQNEPLSADELRTILHESGNQISRHHQFMLLGILDLARASVEDIMVPKNEIKGINLAQDWQAILAQLTASQHTRLLMYQHNLEEIKGLLQVRDALHLLAQNKLDKSSLLTICKEVSYVPEGTPLSVQLVNFQTAEYRSALIVDEYGDILGLVTLEDILEEIVGKFTSDPAEILKKPLTVNADGSYLLDGSVHLRDLYRDMGWQFAVNGAKTLSGAIIKYLETIPTTQTCLRLNGYPLEIVQIKNNRIKTVRIIPALSLVKADLPA